MWPSSWNARIRCSGIGPADVDVRRRDVDAELDAQRPAELQLLLEAARRQHVDRVPREFCERHAGARLPRSWRSFGEIGAGPSVGGSASSDSSPSSQFSESWACRRSPSGCSTALAAKLPQLEPSAQQTQANTYVYARTATPSSRSCAATRRAIIVPSAGISPWMKHAIVAVEDKRFYEHRGVDLRGMARAVWADVTHRGTVQGGSTITQQLVKNAYLTSQKTIARKLTEAALAWQLEQQWSKDRILTAYLNTVYFGNGAYGVEQASKVYFHHSARTLKPAEAALLAGIPKIRAPGIRSLTRRRRRRGATSSCGSSTAGLPHEEPVRELARLPDAEAGERVAARRRRASSRRTSRTTSRTSSSSTTAEGRVRRRPEGDDDARHRPAEDRAGRDREGPAAERHEPGRRARRDRHAERSGRGPRDGRRRELPQEPVQPRDAGRASAGLVVQAVRARDRAQGEHRAVVDPHLVEAGDDQRRRPAVGGQQLRGRGARADQPLAGDRILRQLGVLTADGDRRTENVASTAHELGITSKLPGTSRSVSAPSPRHRSRWRAPMDRSPTAASASTGRSSGTSRARSRRSISEGNGMSTTRSRTTSSPPTRPRPSTSSCRASCSTGRAAPRRFPAGRSPARRGRPRTTVTPGSSATCRSSSSPSGSGTPTSSCR